MTLVDLHMIEHLTLDVSQGRHIVKLLDSGWMGGVDYWMLECLSLLVHNSGDSAGGRHSGRLEDPQQGGTP